jgi:hypothetical protein
MKVMQFVARSKSFHRLAVAKLFSAGCVSA